MKKKNKKSFPCLKNDDGFTILEILVAFTMLILLLSGALIAMNNNMMLALRLKQQLVAVNLAQEGMEIVRNLRDEDWFNGDAFGTTLPEGTFGIDWNDNSLDVGQAYTPLLFDEATNLYSYDSGRDSIYTRNIIVEDVIDGSSISHRKITVEVSWPIRGGTKMIDGELRLYDWR